MTLFIIISYFIFLAILIFEGYLLLVALRRINTYESFINRFYEIVSYASDKMKMVDASGHYESDDETGFFFEQLKDIQTMLNEMFVEEQKTDEK
jgi:hypothetical protein|tara:strand:- start:4578 stop:4859 length:282 start_codon:yes stop_codon:yes gene_type:complete